VGAIALIVAGIGAFLVPFLLRGPALQASSNNGGNTGCTSNCNPGTTTPSCSSNCSTDTNPNTNPRPCASDPSTDSSGHTNEGKHLAKGHDKQDKSDTSLVAKAHGFMATLAKHNPQHDATHSTKTDNDTVKDHTNHSTGHDNDDASACADNKDNDDSEAQDDD
jgi:hypothetical protein